jgi:hypothetical protein
MARPKIPIEPLEVEKLASYGLSNKELAEFCGCSTDTLERRFAAVLRKGRNNLRMRLRVKQIQVAMKGNPALLIFLGKQYLNQADKLEQAGKVEMSHTAKKSGKAPDVAEFAEAFQRVLGGAHAAKGPHSPAP